MVVISEVIKREEGYSKEAFLGERNYKNHKYLVRLVLVLQNRLYPVSWPIRKEKKKNFGLARLCHLLSNRLTK